MENNLCNSNKDNKSTNIKKRFENNGSFLVVKNNTLLVLDSNTLDKPFGALKICSGFYIELNRSINEYNTILRDANIPIIFQYSMKVKNYKYYNIIRMADNIMSDLNIGIVICENDIIKTITFNRNNIEIENNILEYESIGASWLAGTFKYEQNIDKNKENAKLNVLRLSGNVIDITNKSYNNAGIDLSVSYSTVKIKVTAKNNRVKYEFTYILNESKRMYELIMISAL